jgi:thiamine kinase-like enzyme
MVELYLHSPICFHVAVFNEAQEQLYFVLLLYHLKERGWKRVDWIQLAQICDQWRTVMNNMLGTSWVAVQLLASQ